MNKKEELMNGNPYWYMVEEEQTPVKKSSSTFQVVRKSVESLLEKHNDELLKVVKSFLSNVRNDSNFKKEYESTGLYSLRHMALLDKYEETKDKKWLESILKDAKIYESDV